MSEITRALVASSFLKNVAEYIPIQIITIASGIRIAYSRIFRSEKPGPDACPRKTRWYIQSMYTAESTIAVAAAAAVLGLTRKDP